MRKVDVEADLFDLGVSSIQVMMIISKAANAGLDISVSTFYRERTIRDIVRGNKSRFCFWADPDVVDAGKPILILICGDAYFNPDYQNFVREFGRDYAILVLDSYHVYFSSKDNLSWPDLVDVYIRMIRLSLGDRMPKVIAGFCIGGELALSVSRVYTTCIDKPVLLLLDSFANRGAYGPLAFDYPRALGEIRRKLEQETAGLLKSQVLYAYPGEVRLFLASQFTAARIQGGETPEVQAQAQRQFRENASAWRSLLPQCRVEWVASDHWHILGEETMRAIHGMWKIK